MYFFQDPPTRIDTERPLRNRSRGVYTAEPLRALSCPRNVNVQNSEGPNVFNERSEHIAPRGDTLLHTQYTLRPSRLSRSLHTHLHCEAPMASSMGPARVPAQVPRRGRGAARVYIFTALHVYIFTALHVYIFTASCLQNIPRYINRGDHRAQTGGVDPCS